MQVTAIGLIELNSIAAGIDITDKLLKTAEVQLILARTICSGKYLALIGGDVAAVCSSIEAGLAHWESSIIDWIVIPNIHPSVMPAIAGTNVIETVGALGIIEAFSVASLLEAADTAVKTASITLLEIRLAMALGGKAFVSMTGDVSAVRAAVDAGAARVADKGLLVNKVVIPAPVKALYQNYI